MQVNWNDGMANQESRRWVGLGVKRVEDLPFITGRGRYLEDIVLDGMCDVALLRSDYAHARIVAIDTEAARAMPGVLAVVIGDDLAGIGGLPVSGDFPIPAHLPLARGEVKFVGDPVAAVVAESWALAQDALAAIAVEYDPLPVVADPVQALAPGAPLVHAELESNVVTAAQFEAGQVDAEFAAADHTLDIQISHARVSGVPIETRGGIATYDAAADHFTLWSSTQAAWSVRTDVASALGVPEDRVRVITPDVGGAFGAKMTAYREDVLLLALARMVGRPVRWIATRTEDFLSSMHGREAVTDGEVAFDADGRIRALRLRTVVNLGSYLMKLSAGPPRRMLLFPTGAYTIRHLRSEIVSVYTHTGPMGPYRGAGRPEAAYFIERVVSEVAHHLGMDQAEIRRRNFISATAFPYTNISNVTYDSGDYERALDRALELIGYDATAREISVRRAKGEIVGIGIASCVEVSGGGAERGAITLGPDGRVTAMTGTSPHGQGLATSFAQIIGDELGLELDDIDVRSGDTAVGPRGGGTMGSRSLQLGGHALQLAARDVRGQLIETTARMLEVAPEDLVLTAGTIHPVGVPTEAIPLGQVVQTYLDTQPEPEAATGPDGAAGMTATAEYTAEGETFPFGTTIVVVAIDRDTGQPTIERFVAVDDCGYVVNPRLVDGQLVGGIVQGIGEALFEEVAFDGDGQPLTSSLLDYILPRAGDLPTFELDRTVTPSPRNPLGVKGVGEAGTVHTPPAVVNAVMDALRPFGVEALDLPLTAEKLWRVIHASGKRIGEGASGRGRRRRQA